MTLPSAFRELTCSNHRLLPPLIHLLIPPLECATFFLARNFAELIRKNASGRRYRSVRLALIAETAPSLFPPCDPSRIRFGEIQMDRQVQSDSGIG